MIHEDAQAALTTLEDLLVREFRVCQMLHSLTSEERQALAKSDAKAVSALVEEKEAMLDELSQFEDQRRMVIQDLGQKLGIISSSPTIAEIASKLHSNDGHRITRLREGILALSGEIREMTSGNRALAVSALERMDALQTFLLDVCRPSLYYQPPGVTPRLDADATWGVDVGT